MKCKKCKNDIPDISRFCMFCGAACTKSRAKVPAPVQLPSGSWRIQLKKEGVSVTESTPEKCTAKAIAIREGWTKQEKVARETVGAVVDKFLADNAPMLSPSTVKAYKSYREHRFQDLFAADLNRAQWQKAINAEAKAVSPKTVINAWRLVTAALNYAGLDVPNVKLPQQVKKEKAFLDYEQIKVFIDGIAGDEIELPALIALHGLRRSEIYDLTMNDIDLDNDLIRVNGAAVYGENGLVHKATNKNKTSTRTVPIMIPRLKEILTDLQGAQGYIFEGTQRLSERINIRCKRLNLPCVGVHGLRHSAVSLAWHLGWDSLTTMRVFGYANLQTVQNIYTHLAEADKNNNIKSMAGFYNNES